MFSKFAEIFASQGTPQVSTTPAANLPPIPLESLIPAENLPPVSTTPAAKLPLKLRISPRSFEKIRNGPNGIFWGGGG